MDTSIDINQNPAPPPPPPPAPAPPPPVPGPTPGPTPAPVDVKEWNWTEILLCSLAAGALLSLAWYYRVRENVTRKDTTAIKSHLDELSSQVEGMKKKHTEKRSGFAI